VIQLTETVDSDLTENLSIELSGELTFDEYKDF